MVLCSSPAVQRGLESGGRGLPEDQLQPRELRQRPALLQEPEWEHRLAHHQQTGGLCPAGAQEAPATGEGKTENRKLFSSKLTLKHLATFYSKGFTKASYKVSWRFVKEKIKIL